MSMYGAAADVADVDCILNCELESISVRLPSAEAYLHLPMVVSTKLKENLLLLLLFRNFLPILASDGQTSKFDRFSLLNNLPSAVSFAKLNLSRGKRLLVCCHNGKDFEVPSPQSMLFIYYYVDYYLCETKYNKHEVIPWVVFRIYEQLNCH